VIYLRQRRHHLFQMLERGFGVVEYIERDAYSWPFAAFAQGNVALFDELSAADFVSHDTVHSKGARTIGPEKNFRPPTLGLERN